MNTPDSLLKDAQQMDTTRFDYIIVGSGAGGGPLASRLALAGKRVLLVEAGHDPLKAKPSPAYPTAAVGEATRIPLYYAAASEDGEMSWMFSVRHYEDDERQELDEKYNQVPFDPNRPPDTSHSINPKYLDPHPRGGKQGIFYPRSSALGGCTSHHAMIMIAPNGKDWNYIADLTGDASWHADRMRPYFAKLERNLYVAAYTRFFRKLLGSFYVIWRWLVLFFDPRAFVDKGGHGFEGWQPTSFIDPYLVNTIRKTDQPFFKVILRSAISVLHGNSALIARLKAALLRLRVVQNIDFNDINTRRASPEGVFLIPIGTQSETTDAEVGQTIVGSRAGVREFLLRTAKQVPDKLVIVTGVHVTRVLFEKVAEGDPPRAIGIEGVKGDHLYEASPVQEPVPENAGVRFFTRGEVVLCGGSFNTPQLLMLSGIGDRAHLAEHGIHHLRGADGTPLDGRCQNAHGDVLPDAPAVNLTGVGRNMQDRYEVTVISELNKEFTTLDGVSFKPGDLNDPARKTWLSGQKGLYATNGGTLAIIRRSAALSDDEREPDLFTFGTSAAFRGYYWNWAREVFKSRLGSTNQDAHNLWTWVILKAYTNNNGGTVRLRSASPFDMPEICFHSFEETPGDGWKKDLTAMVDAVRFMRRINARNPKQFIHEIQPGKEIADDSPEMEHWIKTQAWGHHACGTCRIGADSWQADPEELNDRRAVLDSHFRVHGVKGLRVVDASVFPKIPGYFILAPILMMSEKAADTLLQDSIRPRSPVVTPKKEVTDQPEAEEDGADEGEEPAAEIGPDSEEGGADDVEEPAAQRGPDTEEGGADEDEDAPSDTASMSATRPSAYHAVVYRTAKRRKPFSPYHIETDALPTPFEESSSGVSSPPQLSDATEGWKTTTTSTPGHPADQGSEGSTDFDDTSSPPEPSHATEGSKMTTTSTPPHRADQYFEGSTDVNDTSSPPETSDATEGSKMTTTSTPAHRAHQCFEGSTDFYNTPEADQYTPSYQEARPLVDNVGKRWEDGRLPPWIKEGDTENSPARQYVEWFNGIWHTGDPSQWGRDVFTNTATTIDPTGITRGAAGCAANFTLLFKYFPELRGEVVSWAANEREILINWRFVIPNKRDRLPIGPITQFLHDQQADRDFLVPVVDKFCFSEGRVSYRLATFDVTTFIGYLSENYGGDELYDFLIAYLWQGAFGGGVALLPRMVVNLFLGLFYWPPLPPGGLYADEGDGFVSLKWEPVEGAEAYKVTRATAISGNYGSPLQDGKDLIIEVKGNPDPTTYKDSNVTNGKAYWYLVTPIYKKWKRTPVSKSAKVYFPPEPHAEPATAPKNAAK